MGLLYLARCLLLDFMKQIGDGNPLRELLNAATPFFISAGLSLQFFDCFYFLKTLARSRTAARQV